MCVSEQIACAGNLQGVRSTPSTAIWQRYCGGWPVLEHALRAGAETLSLHAHSLGKSCELRCQATAVIMLCLLQGITESPHEFTSAK